jgi:hypothetical protein
MSKWPMRGHFRYLRFKTFSMTPTTSQCEVFWALLSSSEHSGVPEDSKSPTLEVLGFTSTLGQSGVATRCVKEKYFPCVQTKTLGSNLMHLKPTKHWWVQGMNPSSWNELQIWTLAQNTYLSMWTNRTFGLFI